MVVKGRRREWEEAEGKRGQKKGMKGGEVREKNERKCEGVERK